VLASAGPTWKELAIAITLILIVYWAMPSVMVRLFARFRNRDLDPNAPGASLRMAGALLVGWGLIALIFRWWWFSAVLFVGGAALQLAGRRRPR
jgi:hypothetical protein